MNEIKIVVEGLNELTEAVRQLASAAGGQIPGRAVPTEMQAPAPAPVTAPVSAPAAMPAQTAAPVSVPATTQPAASMPAGIPVMPPQGYAPALQIPPAAPGTAALPTTAVAQEYTLEQLQVAAAGLSGMGRMQQVLGILQRFGIQAMTELPRERYGEFASALREAGAQI